MFFRSCVDVTYGALISPRMGFMLSCIHILFMDGSHAWLMWMGMLIVLTTVEFVLDVSMGNILGLFLFKLACLAYDLGAVPYHGIGVLVNIYDICRKYFGILFEGFWPPPVCI